MSDHVFDKEHAEIMAGILLWAYEHGLTVKFFRQYSYGGDSHPVIRFSRNDKHIEQAFWPLMDLKGWAKNIWKEVAFNLCIEPPRFL